MERDIIDEFTYRARRDDESELIVDDERKKTGLGGLEQLRVVKRAGGAVAPVEGLVFESQRPRQSVRVSVLVNEASGNQHPLGTDADLGRPSRHCSQELRRQAIANTVELGKFALTSAQRHPNAGGNRSW
jgi:hypothetical protein